MFSYRYLYCYNNNFANRFIRNIKNINVTFSKKQKHFTSKLLKIQFDWEATVSKLVANGVREKMSSGFVTETELAEARKKRQEEWEKVRQPDEPLGKIVTKNTQNLTIMINLDWNIWLLERPEEPYDGRSLYDRLKEQRDKKDLEFEESHKLSKRNTNLIKIISFVLTLLLDFN